MMQLICLFSPAFLAVATLQKLREEPMRNWDFAFALAIFAGVINMLSTTVIAILFQNPTARISEESLTAVLTFKYLALSFAFALVLPYVYDFLKRTVKIELSIRLNPAMLKGIPDEASEAEKQDGKEG